MDSGTSESQGGQVENIVKADAEFIKKEAKRLRGEGLHYTVIAEELNKLTDEFGLITHSHAWKLVCDPLYQIGSRRRAPNKSVRIAPVKRAAKTVSQGELGLESVAEQKLNLIRSFASSMFMTEGERLAAITGILK